MKTLASQWSEYTAKALNSLPDRTRVGHQITFYAGAFFALDCLADSVDGPEEEIFQRLNVRLKALTAEIDERLFKMGRGGA